MNFFAAAGLALNISSMLADQKANARQRRAEIDAARFSEAVYRRRAETVQLGYGQREEQFRRQSRIEAGKRRAAIAQSGTGFDGSNFDIDRQSQIFAELDALNIRYQGQLESDALLEQSDQYGLAARGISSYASAEKLAGRLNVAGTLLSGMDRLRPYTFTRPGTQGAAPAQYGLYGNYPVLS